MLEQLPEADAPPPKLPVFFVLGVLCVDAVEPLAPALYREIVRPRPRGRRGRRRHLHRRDRGAARWRRGVVPDESLVCRGRGSTLPSDVPAGPRGGPRVRALSATAIAAVLATRSPSRRHGSRLLVAERTALNFLQRLSGIATSRTISSRAAAGRSALSNTRKTTPTLRCWSELRRPFRPRGESPRGLFDAILINDNPSVSAGGVQSPSRVPARIAPCSGLKYSRRDAGAGGGGKRSPSRRDDSCRQHVHRAIPRRCRLARHT